VVFYAGGMAFLTVLLNGSTTSYLMESLGMLNKSEAEQTLVRAINQPYVFIFLWDSAQFRTVPYVA
jgi:hypothetical protein